MNEPQRDSASPHLAVAAEVRAQLARKRVSGRQAALALGWKQPYISRRLTGEIPFDVNDLTALADLLGLPVSEFFEVPSTRERVLESALIPTPALQFKIRPSWTLRSQGALAA